MKIDNSTAIALAKKYNIDTSVIDIDVWQYGLNVELEHGTASKLTNVTGDDLDTTAKIAIAHLIEFPDYYVRLKKLESDADAYWSTRTKSSIFIGGVLPTTYTLEFSRDETCANIEKKYLKYKTKYFQKCGRPTPVYVGNSTSAYIRNPPPAYIRKPEYI